MSTAVKEQSRQRPNAVRPLAPFSEQDFRTALLRERRRVERSGDGFVLLEVEGIDGAFREPLDWAAVAESLAHATRSADSIGWLRDGVSLAAILPEFKPSVGVPTALEMRIRRELARRFAHGADARFSIRLHDFSASLSPKGWLDGGAGSPLLAAPVAKARDTLKRALDIIGSALLLLFFLPIWVLIAVAIKLASPGPVLFRQVRIGRGMKPFTMLKFRSMRQDAGETRHKDYVSWYINRSSSAEAGRADQGAGPQVFKLTNDDRVTAVGRFLRRTSLDELPQLWNVLRGDMSLVGPRPPLRYEVEQYKAWHCRRVLDAKPGMTGLWQVTGRSRTTFDEMVRLDLRYARTYSAWGDVKILLATPTAVISGKGAC